ncbi:MAG: zinc-ribbon domain-containing protein [Hyphomonadaceae bacterium]
MILTCTSCLTRYHADDAAIGPSGRSVRCAACGHTWFAEPSLVLEESSPAAERPQPLTRERVERMRKAASDQGPAPSAAARFRAQQHERMRKERVRAAAFAWAGTGAALAASAAGAVMLRNDVVEAWPRSASAFAAFGVDVNVYGLEINDLVVERAFEGATPVLLVSGEIHNIGRDEKNAPPIRITLRDSHSNALFEVVHSVGADQIAAGAATPFQIRLENPPADAVDLEAAFAAYGEAPTQTADAPAADETVLELGPESEVGSQASAEPALRLNTAAADETQG